jgi:two-component system phosphate regulon response regulator PhoB
MAKAAVLIVEDESDIADLLRFHVEREGFEARVAKSGRVALEEVKRSKPDLVMLDLMLPDVDGLEVCRRLKWQQETREIPILMVTAKGEEADIVTGIEMGADDYVTKPFSPRVVMARVKNILRRRETPGGEAADELRRRLAFAGGALVIDPDRHEVLVHDQPVNLTLTEFTLLHFLATRPGFVRTRDQIIAAVRGKTTVLSSRTVDVHVTALRKKLGALGSLVETVRGVGYRLVESAGGDDD